MFMQEVVHDWANVIARKKTGAPWELHMFYVGSLAEGHRKLHAKHFMCTESLVQKDLLHCYAAWCMFVKKFETTPALLPAYIFMSF